MQKVILSLMACSTIASATDLQSTPADSLTSRELETVMVYSTRTPIPLKRVAGKIEVITPRAIEKSGLTDLTEVLKNKSSLDVIQYPGFLSNVGIRGFIPDFSRSRYVAVLINGIPSGTSNLATIGLAGIQQIEVLKGPFSSIYGTNAMGGVINIITKKHTEGLQGSISVGTGSFSSGRSSFNLGGAITEKLSFDLNAAYDAQALNYKTGRKYLLSHSEIEKAILDPTTKGKEMPLSYFGAFKGSLRLGYQFSPNWSLNVCENLFLGGGIPNGGSIWGVYGAGKKDLNRTMTSAELRGRIGNNQLSFTPYYSRETNDSYKLNGNEHYVNYSGITTTWGAMLQDELSIGQHKLVIGLDTRNQDSDSKRFKADGSADVLYKPNSSSRTLGIFTQGNVRLLDDALNISAGLRADFMSFTLDAYADLKSQRTTEHFNIVSPNLGLKYELTKGLMLHASIGSAFSAPDAYQKAGEYETAYGITRGNASLKPETSLTYDFGLGYTNTEIGLQLDATYFDTHHKQMIVQVPAGKATVTAADGTTKELSVNTFANSDKARMRGLELVASYDLGTMWDYRFSLRTFVNATLMFDSRVKMDANDEWKQLESIRKQNITFGVEYSNPRGFELGLNARFLGKRYERNWFGSYATVRPGLDALVQSQTPELVKYGQLLHPAALIFSASAHYNVTKKLRLGVNLNNLFDEHYTEKDGYHMPGRNVYFSASYRF
ncbi:MAG: TonB-dependent receptor [Phocaeicola sp.]|nr:TonB-dependent receptor [Phocaeicola sp.]